MNEREPQFALIRDTDRWLRRAAFYGPAIGLILGWQLGFLNAAWLFRDHEKRITCLEAWHTQHDLDDKKDHEGSSAFEAVVRERLHLR